MATPSPTLTNSTPPLNLMSKVGVLARDIKLSHTVFAMPFALLGMVLAACGASRRVTWSEAGLIVLCMVLARTFAMSVNRLADAKLDAANPRTQNRAAASGRLSPAFMRAAIFTTAAGFVLATLGFWWLHHNAAPAILSVPVLFLLGLYSYMKRWTWLCHVYLGFALAISPLAAAIAIEPGYLQASWTLWLIAAAVLCWVGGFDVIYALQDVAVDRQLGLHSMPASLGVEPALWISRGLHTLSAVCLFGAGAISPQLHTLFFIACVLTAALLLLEHTLVWRSQTNHIHLAFFTVNGVISLLLGLAGILDAWLG